jgi:hypothetical protein
MAGVDGYHDGVDLMNHIGQTTAVALFQQPHQVFFKKVRVQFVTLSGKG